MDVGQDPKHAHTIIGCQHSSNAVIASKVDLFFHVQKNRNF